MNWEGSVRLFENFLLRPPDPQLAFTRKQRTELPIATLVSAATAWASAQVITRPPFTSCF
jgi:hypothetical protein